MPRSDPSPPERGLASRNPEATIEFVIGQPHTPFRESAGSPPEELYDDAQDHQRCSDCKGSGYYVGFLERSFCRNCDGSGWI
jgi:hypothetical protein